MATLSLKYENGTLEVVYSKIYFSISFSICVKPFRNRQWQGNYLVKPHEGNFPLTDPQEGK